MHGLSTHSRRSRYRQTASVYFLGAVATVLITVVGGLEGEIGLPSMPRLALLPIGLLVLGCFAFLIWKNIPWLSRSLLFLFVGTSTIRLIQFLLNALGRRFEITYWPPSVTVQEFLVTSPLLFAVNALIVAIILAMLLRAALTR